MINELNTVLAALHGTRFPAGNYHATVLADMDFETYSEAGFVWDEQKRKWGPLPGVTPTNKGLSSVGAVVYCHHPTFEVLSLKYDLKDGRGPRFWKPGLPNPQDLFDHLARGLELEAHNIGFERRVWRRCEQLYGWPPIEPYIPQLRCSMAKARAFAYPGALGKAAPVAGTLQKDAAGEKGIKLFCVPQNPTAKKPALRVMPEDEPELFQSWIVDYNEVDIQSEAHLSANTPDLFPLELEYWQADQAINDRGVQVDTHVLRQCVTIMEAVWHRYGAEFARLTGGIEPSKVQQFRAWLSSRGLDLPDMTEETVTDAVARTDLPADVHRALVIRSLVGSASVKKVYAMLNQSQVGSRLYDLFSFHATRTGRPTGNGPQPTNLPRSGPDVWLCQCGRHYGAMLESCGWCQRGPEGRTSDKPLEWSPEAMHDAIDVLATGSYQLVEMLFGDVLLTLAGCLRGMFTAAPGKRLISSDYTAIEAVVLACLAGEQWRIDLFAEGGKIYEKSGALVLGLEYEDMLRYKKETGQNHPGRQVGKVAELALGYQGWIGAWKQFDKGGKMDDDEIKKVVLAWRAASPAIVEFWGGQSRRVGRGLEWELFGVEGAFITSILNPGQQYHYRGLTFVTLGRELNEFGQMAGGATYIYLPSGRALTYHNPELRQSDKWGCQYSISFEGWNTNPKNGPPQKWIRMDTWGGRLVENIVQAVSNDILRHATLNLERRGYPVVLHVYDEIVSEVPEGFGSVEELESIMKDLPHWAVLPDGRRWPVGAAGGWEGFRYRKG